MIAGNPMGVGFSDNGGLPTTEYLDHPWGLVIDPAGNLYIADTENHRIRRINNERYILSTSDRRIKLSKDDLELYVFDNHGRHLETHDAISDNISYRFTYESNGYLSSISNIDNDITQIERLTDGTPVAIITPDGERTEITLDNNGYARTLTNPAGATHELSYLEGGLLNIYTDPKGNRYDYDYDAKGRLIDDRSPTGAGWELAITEQTKTSRTVTKTSKEGRETHYQSETLATEAFQRTFTYPDGTTIVSLQKTTGETTSTSPDGTVMTITQGPDPRFGMSAPNSKEGSTILPSGLSSHFTVARTADLSDPSDIFSLTQLSNEFTLNGKTSTTVYDVATKTNTVTSAQGRTESVKLDDKDRPIENQTTGLNPLYSEYDSRGRAQRISTGNGAELRESLFSYYQTGDMKGYLQSVTNALGQTSSFEYDLSGRITQQTLPDARQINYQYDANGNLIRLIPDGRPAHQYDYDGLDQTIAYLPPELIDISDPITTYQYNKDRQVTLITRPDGDTITPVYNLITGKL